MTHPRATSPGEQMSLFLQGALLSAASGFIHEEEAIFSNALVQQPVDEAGVIRPFFRIHLASGIVLRVEVRPEIEP